MTAVCKSSFFFGTPPKQARGHQSKQQQQQRPCVDFLPIHTHTRQMEGEGRGGRDNATRLHKGKTVKGVCVYERGRVL